MAISFNSSHPLASDVVALFCVNESNQIVDLLGGQTCTPDAAVVVGTGTYGRHFTTSNSGNNALGVAFSPGFATKPVANPVGWTFIVANEVIGRFNRGCAMNAPGTNTQSPGCNTGDAVSATTGTGTPSVIGTTDLINGSAQIFGAAWTGTTAHLVHANGSIEGTGGQLGNASDTNIQTYIGGAASGGFGALAARYVYVVHFRRYPTAQEISDLTATVGANNAFGLVTITGSGSSLTADSMTYSTTLQDANLVVNLTLPAESLTFNTSIQDATLSSSSSFVLVAEPFSYSVALSDGVSDTTFVADTINYTSSLQNANLTTTAVYTLVANTITISSLLQDAGLVVNNPQNVTMPAESLLFTSSLRSAVLDWPLDPNGKRKHRKMTISFRVGL